MRTFSTAVRHRLGTKAPARRLPRPVVACGAGAGLQRAEIHHILHGSGSGQRVQRMCPECEEELQRQPAGEEAVAEEAGEEDGIPPDGRLARSPLCIQRFSADVKCNATKVGALSFPTYATAENTTKLGLTIGGSFASSTDPAAAPCSCGEIRWIQVIDTNVKANEGWGSFRYVDPQPEDDPANEPFYWRSAKLTGETNPEIARHRGGSGATSTLSFNDTPMRFKSRLDTKSPLNWKSELCLVCVDRPKKEILRLGCLGYGFKMSKDGSTKKVELDPAAIQDKGGGTSEHKDATNAYGGGWKEVDPPPPRKPTVRPGGIRGDNPSDQIPP